MAFFCINCKSSIEPRFKACPFCGEPITDFLRRYLESPIDGKYQILSRLGIGGMGEVYKVLHLHLNAVRVIKLMRPQIMKEEGARERFLREARLATRIQSPYVAALFDFSTLEDGSHYMVWEYIEGTNLSDLIRARGCLSPKYTARLSHQALLGLDAIHRVGVVHRDISPENLMITHDEEGEERVKIIDLGIAKQWGDSMDDKTKTGIFVGKWKYCSPEHLGMLKEGERIDGRADLYSFGIVMYEMLTGAPPFVADTPHRYLLLHAAESPKPLAVANPGVTAGAELESLIFRALEKDRSKRFATSREFAKSLEVLIPKLDDTAATPVAVEWVEESTEERLAYMNEADEEPTESTDAATGQFRETFLDTVDSAAAKKPAADTETVPTAALEDTAIRRKRSAADEETVPAATLDDLTLRRRPRAAGDDAVTVAGGTFAASTPPASDETPTVVADLSDATVPTLDTRDDEARGAAVARRKRWGLIGGIAAAAIIVVVIFGILEKAKSQGRVTTGTVVASTMPPAQMARLGINAYPWGEVLSIRNLDNGKPIEMSDRIVTPAGLDLPAGKYEIVVSNPSFAPSTQVVTLSQGATETVMVQFEKAKDFPPLEGNFQ